MATESLTRDELDDEFDKCLVSMKPHVLHLKHKSERQRSANWIKKLCESPGSGPTARKNRNMYTRLLLHMLQRGLVEGPFSHRPESGPLPTLPAYTSIYFDEPGQPSSQPVSHNTGAKSLPDWITGELADNYSSSSAHSRHTLEPHVTSSYLPDHQHHRRSRTENGVQFKKLAREEGTKNHPESRVKQSFSFSSDDDEENMPRRVLRTKSPGRTTRNSGNAETGRNVGWRQLPTSLSDTTQGFSHAGASLREDASLTRQHDKDSSMRIKMMEAKFHEEKLGLQQSHDKAIKKILDRKNCEMEDIKSHYRSKSKESEETIRKLEKRVQSMLKESTLIKESKDQQIAELHKMVEHSDLAIQNEYEKKLHEKTADFEQEKFDMQKQQTKAIQDILDDTNARLNKMELEYSTQVDSHAAMIQELEARIMQLSQESDHHTVSQTKLGQEKAELDRENKLLNTELNNVNTRYASLKKELHRIKEDYTMETRSLKSKMDASIEFNKQENTLSSAKSAETIRELEQHIQDLKQSLKESEHQRQRQLRDIESIQSQDKVRLETLHEKQLSSLKADIERERQENQRKLLKLQQDLRDKDENLHKLDDQKKLQGQQAEKALEEFRQQVERNSGRMFDEMKTQMVKVEADLIESKELRETQTRELSRQLDQERLQFQKQLSEQERKHSQARAKMTQQYQSDQAKMQQEHGHILAATGDRLQHRLNEEQQLNSLRCDKDTRMISDLEQEVRDLKEVILENSALHKQQLVELGLLRDDEKHKLMQESQAMFSKLKSEMEQERLRLQSEHSAELERTLQQTNSTLQSIENNYTQRLDKSAQTIKQLKGTIDEVTQQSKSCQGQKEREMADAVSRLQDEKELIKKQQSAYIKRLHHDADKYRTQFKQVERQLQQRNYQHQDQVTHLKQEYEARMRGLMPLSARQELEDTITSLKSQVILTQQKSALLQEEIDTEGKQRPTVRPPSRI